MSFRPKNQGDIIEYMFRVIEDNLHLINQVVIKDTAVPAATVIELGDKKSLLFAAISNVFYQNQLLKPIKEPTDEFMNGVAMDIQSFEADLDHNILYILIERG